MKQSVTMQLPAHFNTPDSHMGFDCIASRALVLNFYSNSVLLVLKLYIVQTEALREAVYTDCYAHFSTEIRTSLATWWLF